MVAGDIIKVIEEFAPLSIQEKWDNSGLCIGSMQDEVKGVIIGLDCTESLVDEAIECGADMIVTHHPLIFSGLKKISPEDVVGAAVTKAIRAGICVYAAHTSADKVMSGVSGAMAERLGLADVNILEDEGEGFGLGVVGRLESPMEYGNFVEYVKEKFGLKVLKSSAPLSSMVEKVAMCGGSGGSLIEAAMKSGAQVYITGDVSYHNYFTPEGFAIMDIGHYESEIEIVQILFSLLKKNFPNFAVCKTQNINSNPIFYF